MRPTLVIRRSPSTPEGTFGRATFTNGIDRFDLHSLELPAKGNAHDLSCIPVGSYIAYVFHSPHFRRDVLRLIAVPGREAIEIHAGNFAGDETQGFYTDVRGCILLGQGEGTLSTPKGNRQLGVVRSNAALDQVIDAMGDSVEIDVIISEGNAS